MINDHFKFFELEDPSSEVIITVRLGRNTHTVYEWGLIDSNYFSYRGWKLSEKFIYENGEFINTQANREEDCIMKKKSITAIQAEENLI